MSITAVIPVREGSRRLKNKNVAPFAGTNLLINKINQLKQVKEISDIVVSSDSETMLAMAYSQGVKIHRRALEFCDEKSKTFGEVVSHICENVSGDDILWATCTAPLVFPKHYSEAIQLYYKAIEEGYDSLVSMEAFKRYLWDEKGPVNYEFGLGRGIGYLYAHDFPNHYVSQQYLPYELTGREFYRPSGNGYEVKIRQHMQRIRKEAETDNDKNS